MRSKTKPLLCELHAHTTWSDGELKLDELVDLYGQAGFDVLCVTDHVVRRDDPFTDWVDAGGIVTAANHAAYVAAILAEAERAHDRYQMLLIPGIELTYNDLDPDVAAHAVAIGCHEHFDLDDGIELAMLRARRSGAAIVAAHPHTGDGGHRGAGTRRFSKDWEELAPLVDRYELFNRRELFGWVAEAGLPGVANGDFHRPGDLSGWKTLIPCQRDERSVVDYLRSSRPVYLAQVEAGDMLGRVIAA
jgi:predicted metal-dependent phosphoesterase TrpH